MKREEFLEQLRKSLQGLPKEDIEDRINFYNESISDRMEDGKTEEEAIADIGSVDEVVKKVANETPLNKLVKERIRPKRRLRGWEIAIIASTFPFWLPFLITFLVLLFVGFILIWTGVIVAYSVETGLVASSMMGIAGFTASFMNGNFNTYYLGISLASFGAAILLGFGCVGITKANIKLSKLIVLGIKSWFIRKGDK